MAQSKLWFFSKIVVRYLELIVITYNAIALATKICNMPKILQKLWTQWSHEFENYAQNCPTRDEQLKLDKNGGFWQKLFMEHFIHLFVGNTSADSKFFIFTQNKGLIWGLKPIFFTRKYNI